VIRDDDDDDDDDRVVAEHGMTNHKSNENTAEELGITGFSAVINEQ
jgi:hypothetical protein